MHDIFNGFYTQGINKVIISKPKNKSNEYKKIVILKKKDNFFAEKFTEKQAFHQNLSFEDSLNFCIENLQEDFSQLNAFDDNYEYSILVSKKGKTSFIKKKLDNISNNQIQTDKNNRTKNYILKEGEIIPPLVDMGIFTKEGKVVKSMYDKFKQINRFIEIVDDVIPENIESLNVIDFGCGKSYLTFILYYYLKFIKKINANIIGLDLKESVINNCNTAAKKYGYEGLKFELGDINGYKTPFTPDMVISLHACDTATDFALYNAVNWGAKIILSVPCCQHELNEQFKTENLELFSEFGIIKERISALTTDAIRGNLLKACGYKTQIMEFVDLSHTPKNLLIRAVKTNIPEKNKKIAIAQVNSVIEEFNLKPTLYNLLATEHLSI